MENMQMSTSEKICLFVHILLYMISRWCILHTTVFFQNDVWAGQVYSGIILRKKSSKCFVIEAKQSKTKKNRWMSIYEFHQHISRSVIPNKIKNEKVIIKINHHYFIILDNYSTKVNLRCKLISRVHFFVFMISWPTYIENL